MEYMSPGDAFSSSIANTLAQRDQLARQAQQDALNQQKEARLAIIRRSIKHESQKVAPVFCRNAAIR